MTMFDYGVITLVENYREKKVITDDLIWYTIEGAEPVILVTIREWKDSTDKARGYDEHQYLIRYSDAIDINDCFIMELDMKDPRRKEIIL